MDNLKELYTKWAMDYCNNYFEDEDLPAGFKLAVSLLVETDPLDYDITNESLHDMSIGRSGGNEVTGIPMKILKWLEPYRRLKTV